MTRQEEFRRRAARALGRPGIRNALGKFGVAYRTARAEALSALDYEAHRKKLRASKEAAIENLPELTRRFIAAATRAGAHIYEATTAEDAASYITRLARGRGVTSVVKSKSMVSEEIELNAALAAARIEVVETDCGEWIIQQAGERPSHSVMPAIHLSREEVAAIFTKALGRPLPPDIPTMVSTLRQEIRPKFVEAGIGISGANLAIAETGTLVLVTNEGNGALTTSCPPIHVALLGYDKIVPGFEEAGHHLKILARAATAQGLTVYTHFITGKMGASALPRPAGWRGPSSAAELHIVLLDNGRSAMREDPEFREALYCIRCASCANVCPTYKVVGGHVFGHIYTAVIGAVITPFHHGWEAAAVPQEACLLCRACYDACPAEIDLPRMVVALRSRLEERRPSSGPRSVFLTEILPRPRLLRAALRAASLLQWPCVRDGVISQLPGRLGRMTAARTLPALPLRRLRDRVKEITPARGQKKMTVVFFGSCLLDFLYPEIGEAVVEVLTREGVEVRFPVGQSCCGLPAYSEGKTEAARRMALSALDALDGECPIVTASPPCAAMLRQTFPTLLAEDPAATARANALAARCHELSEFLVEVLRVGERDRVPPSADPVPLVWHDSCSGLRGLHLQDPPRRLLRSLPGYEIRELDEPGECCGFGGHFSFDYPEVADHVLERKRAAIERTGARVVVTDSPGCLLQIRGGLLKRGSAIRAVHLAELLAEALFPPSPEVTG